MKVLILSVRVGSGHTAIAKNIAQCFENHGDTVVVKEMFEDHKFYDWVIADLGFKCTFKLPRLTNYFYKKAYKSDKHVFHQFVKGVKEKLIALVNSFEPDIIISTHIAGRIFVKAYGQHFNKPVVNYMITTDYELPPGIVDYQPNEYIIVPNNDFSATLIKKGFPAESILPYGVPIKPQYYTEISKQTALKKLNLSLDDTKKTVLLMGKKNGLGKTYKIIKHLSKYDDLQIINLYGSNKKLKKCVDKLSKKSVAKIYNFDFNSEYIMSIPDVIICKTGGLSSTEALTKSLPIISYGYSPKPEYTNLEYFKEKHLAVSVKYINELHDKLCTTDLKELKANCQLLRNVDSAEKIYTHAQEAIKSIK